MVQMWMKFIRKDLDYSYKSCILAVETTCEHKAQVFPINNSYFEEGIKEFKRLICIIAYYYKYGELIDIE